MLHRAQADQSNHDLVIQTTNHQLENIRQQLQLAQTTNEDLNQQLTRRTEEINTLRVMEKDTLAMQQQQLADLQTTLSNTKAFHEKTLSELQVGRMKTRCLPP